MVQCSLCLGVALFGGETIPADGFRVVPFHPPTGAEHDAEVVLSTGVPLFGGTAVPPDSFTVVLRHPRDRRGT